MKTTVRYKVEMVKVCQGHSNWYLLFMPAFNVTVIDAVQLEKYEHTKKPFCVTIE